MSGYLSLGDDLHRKILLHLDLDALCAIRRSVKSHGRIVTDVAFWKAWVALQKVLSDKNQQRLLQCLCEEGVVASTDLSPAASCNRRALYGQDRRG